MPKFDDISRPARPPLCATAPVLWSLLPMILGIMSADMRMPLWALVLTLAIVQLIRSPCRTHKTVVAISFAVGFLSHALHTEQAHSVWRLLPKREVVLLMEIDEMFTARNPEKISGIGIILQTDIPHDTISGNKVSFYLEIHEPGTVSPGQIFLCKGVISYLPQLDEHDGFQDYLLRRDIFITYNQGKVLMRTRPALLIERLRSQQFQFFQTTLTSGMVCPDSPGNVLGSMLLGDRRLLRDEQIDLYRQSGTYHLFAVSGLHVGCVALFISGLVRLCRLSGRWIVPPVLIITWYYVWLTGLSPSASRAGIMISCLICSRMLLRQPHLFPALAFSAWIVLVFHPQQLFNLGFQLSYSVVGSIILIGLPTSNALNNRIQAGLPEMIELSNYRRRILRFITGIVDLSCISISAGIVSMPLIMEHFQIFTPGGVIMGIVLNPLSTAVIMLGCLTMCIAPLSIDLAYLIAGFSWPLIELIEWILEICIKVPGAYSTKVWIVPHLGTGLVVLTIMVAWILQYLRQRSIRLSSVTLLLPVLIVITGIYFGALDA